MDVRSIDVVHIDPGDRTREVRVVRAADGAAVETVPISKNKAVAKKATVATAWAALGTVVVLILSLMVNALTVGTFGIEKQYWPYVAMAIIVANAIIEFVRHWLSTGELNFVAIIDDTLSQLQRKGRDLTAYEDEPAPPPAPEPEEEPMPQPPPPSPSPSPAPAPPPPPPVRAADQSTSDLSQPPPPHASNGSFQRVALLRAGMARAGSDAPR
jgi:hypothetical protein